MFNLIREWVMVIVDYPSLGRLVRIQTFPLGLSHPLACDSDADNFGWEAGQSKHGGSIPPFPLGRRKGLAT